MYKICKTLQSSERQKKFGQTLFKMMETQPFRKITVSALCREMGAPRRIPEQTYFARDQDIFHKWVRENYPDTLIVGSCSTEGTMGDSEKAEEMEKKVLHTL